MKTYKKNEIRLTKIKKYREIFNNSSFRWLFTLEVSIQSDLQCQYRSRVAQCLYVTRSE